MVWVSAVRILSSIHSVNIYRARFRNQQRLFQAHDQIVMKIAPKWSPSIQFPLLLVMTPYKNHFAFLGLNFLIYKMKYLKSDPKIWTQKSTWGILQSLDSHILLDHLSHNLGALKFYDSTHSGLKTNYVKPGMMSGTCYLVS